jgi:hypothetical protein
MRAKRDNTTGNVNRALSHGLPVVTVLSLSAAATVSMAGTASAATSTGDHGARMKATIQSWLAAHPAALKHANASAPAAAGTDATQNAVVANFGLGKAAIPVEAMPDTFPSSMTPVFDGLNLQATMSNANGVDGNIPCFLMANSPATPITTTDPDDCIVPIIPEGDSYTVAPGEGATVPAGFLMPAGVTGAMTDDVAASCTFADPVDGGGNQIPYCIGPTLQVPGIWNPIEATVTNSITGKPVKGVTYTLFGSSDQGAPQTALRATRSLQQTGVPTPLGTATTDAAGHLRFPSVYLGGDYTILENHGPKGYRLDTHTHSFSTPVVSSLAQAGHAFTKGLTLKPQAPTLNDDASGGAFGATQTIHVLANDSTPVGGLTVTSVTKPAHGTLQRKANGTYVYKPNAGFVGTDHFTYTARNSLGATSSAQVTVIVHPQVKAEADVLPFTGSPTAPMLDAGLVSLAIGALLTASGVRRRRTT